MKNLLRKLAVVAIGFTSVSTYSHTQAQAQTICLGEVITVGFNFCPRGYADATGSVVSINSNQALFSIYGTMYGGDGRTTFGYPDTRGRSILSVGDGPGITPTPNQGATGGSTQFTLTTSQLPSHNHSANANQTAADNQNPSGDTLGAALLYNKSAPNVAMNSNTIGHAGANIAVNKRSPYTGLKYCVATTGSYCSRN